MYTSLFAHCSDIGVMDTSLFAARFAHRSDIGVMDTSLFARLCRFLVANIVLTHKQLLACRCRR